MYKQYLENLGFEYIDSRGVAERWQWIKNQNQEDFFIALSYIDDLDQSISLHREFLWDVSNADMTITVIPTKFNKFRDSRKMKDGEITTFILTKTSEGIEAKSKQEGFTFVFFNEFDFDVVIETLKKENTNLKFEINDSRKMKDYFGRQLFEDVYVLDEFIINGQKFYLLEGFYVKNDTIAYAITSDYNGELYWNGAGTILENEQEARQLIQEMKGSIKDSKKEQSITDSLTYDEFANRYNKFENRTKKRFVDFRKVKDSDYVIPEELEYGDMIVGDFNINLGNGTEKRRMTLELKRVEGKKYYFTIQEYGMTHLTYEINEESLRKAKANYV